MADSKVTTPADTAFAPKTNSKGERVAHEDGKGEGVHPALVNPDQPAFPRPFGVSDDDLREQGVGHAYIGVGSESQAEDAEEQANADPDTQGADAGPGGEGKPADPEAAEKQQAAAKVAEAHKPKAHEQK